MSSQGSLAEILRISKGKVNVTFGLVCAKIVVFLYFSLHLPPSLCNVQISNGMI